MKEALVFLVACACTSCASGPTVTHIPITGVPEGTIEEVEIPGTGRSFSMIFVSGGEALIGTPADVPGRRDDEPFPTSVRLDPYWIGQFEVTFDEYAIFGSPDRDSDVTTGGQPFDVDAVARPSPPYEDPMAGLSGPGKPATGMTQWGALQYARWLSDKTGAFYRLPTEAEWEHACRLGGERVPDSNSWYVENSGERMHDVGTKSADALGLHDMLGNVAEWMLDQYRSDYAVVVGEDGENPWAQPTALHPRTVRGAAFDDEAADLRCGARTESTMAWKRRDPQIPKSFWWNTDSPFLGFRLVRPERQPSPDEAAEFWAMVLGD